MSNPNNQQAQERSSNNNPEFIPDSLQGTDDSQSEFSVNEMRAERREDENRIDEHAENDAPPKESNTAETQSEFSVNERLRGHP